MKLLTILLLRLQVKLATKRKNKFNESFIVRAYDDMIKSYNTSIIFLEAKIDSKKKK